MLDNQVAHDYNEYLVRNMSDVKAFTLYTVKTLF